MRAELMLQPLLQHLPPPGDHAALQAMAGEKATPQQQQQEHSEAWVLNAVDMAVSWCALLASHLTFTQVEISVGMAGLAAALALCSNPRTCAEFLVGGGHGVLVGELVWDVWEVV